MLPPRYCSCVSAVTQKTEPKLLDQSSNAFMSCVVKVYLRQARMFPCRTHKVNGRGSSLTAQMVKNPPAMRETPVQFLGQEDLLEKG